MFFMVWTELGDRTWNSAWNDEPQDPISLRLVATM